MMLRVIAALVLEDFVVDLESLPDGGKGQTVAERTFVWGIIDQHFHGCRGAELGVSALPNPFLDPTPFTNGRNQL